MRHFCAAFAALLALVTTVRAQSEDDGSYHFTDASSGRAAWVVDTESLPWIGSFDYLGSDVSPSTILMTVVDSSTGAPLGECSVMNADRDDWEHFVWTLSVDSLLCNVSETNSSRVRFPLSTHPRTFSVRIQSTRGPRCLREVTVQNERPVGCPPHLRRNAFTAAGLVCGCPFAETTAESESENPAFPIFKLDAQQPHETPAWTVSPCADVQCLNNGTCVVGADGAASCLCLSGFSGQRCQNDVCASVPCAHGGKCRSEGATAVCDCPPHTKGILCEQVVCEPACAQGDCSLVDGAPMCECSQGFIGPNCNVIDVCIGDAACAVFGEHAKCTLDAASYTTVSAKVVNASYDCHCPHPQTGQWMDCMTLVLSSTQASASSSEEASHGTQSTPHASDNSSVGHNEQHSSSPSTHAAVPVGSFGAHNVVTATAPSRPHIIASSAVPVQRPSSVISEQPFSSMPTTTTTTTATSAQETSGQFNFMPFVPQTGVPELPMQPFTTTVSPSEEEESEEEATTEISFIPHGQTLSPVPSGISSETTIFPTPSPMDVSEMETTDENLGAGFETSVAINLPDPSEASTESGFVQTTVEQTTQPMLVTDESSEITTESVSSTQPQTTNFPMWPHEHVTTEPPLTTEESKEETESMETTQSVLPFWMMTTTTEAPPPVQFVTTQAPIDNVEEEEPTEEEEEHGVEQPHPTPAVPVHRPITEHAWPTTRAPPEEETTRSSVATGSSGQSSGGTASIIAAIIAVAFIIILLVTGVFFVMRYVRQSRKLHGKYNPAREEHALSAAYALPMTHVTKEERLI